MDAARDSLLLTAKDGRELGRVPATLALAELVGVACRLAGVSRANVALVLVRGDGQHYALPDAEASPGLSLVAEAGRTVVVCSRAELDAHVREWRPADPALERAIAPLLCSRPPLDPQQVQRVLPTLRGWAEEYAAEAEEWQRAAAQHSATLETMSALYSAGSVGTFDASAMFLCAFATACLEGLCDEATLAAALECKLRAATATFTYPLLQCIARNDAWTTGEQSLVVRAGDSFYPVTAAVPAPGGVVHVLRVYVFSRARAADVAQLLAQLCGSADFQLQLRGEESVRSFAVREQDVFLDEFVKVCAALGSHRVRMVAARERQTTIPFTTDARPLAQPLAGLAHKPAGRVEVHEVHRRAWNVEENRAATVRVNGDACQVAFNNVRASIAVQSADPAAVEARLTPIRFSDGRFGRDDRPDIERVAFDLTLAGDQQPAPGKPLVVVVEGDAAQDLDGHLPLAVHTVNEAGEWVADDGSEAYYMLDRESRVLGVAVTLTHLSKFALTLADVNLNIPQHLLNPEFDIEWAHRSKHAKTIAGARGCGVVRWRH